MSEETPELAAWYRPEVTDAARAARAAHQRRRTRVAVGLSVGITLTWLVFVTIAGHWPRVRDNWIAGVTMIFGSFVAGSTPQGSGAVAFPVFTKVLGVPADVARSFSLCIQTVGMGTAAAAIVITRRLVEWRAAVVGGGAAAVALVGTLVLLGDARQPFWSSTLPAPYVRVTFTLVLTSMAFVVYLGTRVRIRKIETELPPMHGRLYAGLALAGLLGGLASGLVGSGADVLIYLFVVVLFGLDPKVGLPTSVIVMAATSATGFLVLGVGHGQLDVRLAGDAASVAAVGGQAVAQGLAARRYDLFGMWLAAVPIVCWGAPLGSWVASRVSTRQLLRFVIVMAGAELVTTAIFMQELHRPGPLLAFAVFGLAALMGLLYLVARHRAAIFALPGLDLEQSLSHDHLDVAAGFEEQVRRHPHER